MFYRFVIYKGEERLGVMLFDRSNKKAAERYMREVYGLKGVHGVSVIRVGD